MRFSRGHFLFWRVTGFCNGFRIVEMARDRRSDPVGRFVIDMIGELQFGRLVRVVFQEVLWDFESRTLNGVLPLAGTGPIVAPECGYLEYVVP